MTGHGAMLRPLDWAVLGLYFALLVTTGILLSRRKPKGADEYFLADRRMPAWAVAISLLATIQSAATFVGVPEQGYGGDLRYLSTNIGAVLAALILFKLFIPVYYRLNVSTPYQLLSVRFGPGAMVAASITYMAGRVLASGARIFIGAVPFSIAVFGDADPPHIAAVTAGFMVFGILFTFAGGVRSVIWTDVLQVAVYIGAAVTILLVLLWKIPAGPGEIWTALAHPPGNAPSKLTILKLGIDPSAPGWGFDPSESFTLLSVVFGFMLLNLAAIGTDQDLAQRTLTCESPVRAGWSVIGGTLIGIPAALLFSAIGLLLYIFYQRPDVMGVVHPVDPVGGSAKAFISFSLTQMPAGMAGLMLAGMLAAGPAGINASLNAMSSSVVNDLYRPAFPDRTDRHYLRVGRLSVVFWGVVLGVFAWLCSIWQQGTKQTLIDFALSVMTFAYAGLLGVFLTALLTRRGNSATAVAALVSGFVFVLAMQPFAWTWWTGLTPWTSHHLSSIKIAYPWHLLMGTLLAAGVCCLGRPSPKPADDG